MTGSYWKIRIKKLRKENGKRKWLRRVSKPQTRRYSMISRITWVADPWFYLWKYKTENNLSCPTFNRYNFVKESANFWHAISLYFNRTTYFLADRDQRSMKSHIIGFRLLNRENHENWLKRFVSASFRTLVSVSVHSWSQCCLLDSRLTGYEQKQSCFWIWPAFMPTLLILMHYLWANLLFARIKIYY